MAVHVIPYNPWREQLALTALGNVAGDILGDMWKAHRQNEQNRKANVFRGQLQQDLQNNSTQPDISLMSKNDPDGYNSNPWAAAFHQNNRPVEQFDIGASAIGKTPSLQDITRAADTLAATKRFSMLDPKTVNDIRDGMMRNTIGDMFGNAGDITGQMNTLARGAAMGLVAPQVLTAFGPFGQKMAFPYSFGETDIGQSKVITARNEHTGEITPGLIMPVSVSPNTAANNASAEKVANIHANATIGAANIGAEADYARAQAAIQAKQLEIWQKQHDALKAEIDNDTANLADIKNDKDRAIMQGLIAQKRQKLAQLEQRIAGGYQGMTAQGGFTGAINDGGQFDDLINTYSKKYDVDPDLIAALIQVESGGRNGLTSSAGAQGLMQIMPDTQKYLGITDPWNPAQNIDGGIRYFKEMLDKFGGDVRKALRAYNAGPGNVPKGQMPKYKYVDDVMAIYNRRKSARGKNSKTSQQQTSTQATNQSQPQTIGQPPATSPATTTPAATTPSQGTPYLRNPDTGIALSLEEFEQLRDQNHTSADELFRALTDRGYELDNGQQTAQKSPAPNNSQSATASVPADTPKNETRTNWAFSLPGQPNFPQAYSAQDVIGAINSVKNNENPFARPNVQDWHEPLNPAPVAPVSADANPWSYVQENTPNSPAFDLNTPIFSGGIPDGAEYNPQPGAFPDGYYDKNRNNLTPYARRGNPRQDYFSPWQIADFFRWINQFQNNENPFARPNFSYKPRAFPAQTPYPYTGNMAGSLLPSNAYDRMKTDGEYIFLDPRLYGR